MFVSEFKDFDQTYDDPFIYRQMSSLNIHVYRLSTYIWQIIYSYIRDTILSLYPQSYEFIALNLLLIVVH